MRGQPREEIYEVMILNRFSEAVETIHETGDVGEHRRRRRGERILNWRAGR